MAKRKPSSELKKRFISLAMKRSWAKRKAEGEKEAARLREKAKLEAAEDYRLREKQGLLTLAEKRRERDRKRRNANAALKSLEFQATTIASLPGFEKKIHDAELKLGRKLTVHEKLKLGTTLLFGTQNS